MRTADRYNDDWGGNTDIQLFNCNMELGGPLLEDAELNIVAGRRYILARTRSASVSALVACGGRCLPVCVGVDMPRARARLRRYGLIGRNGIGKTTFLRHLAAKTFEGKSK